MDLKFCSVCGATMTTAEEVLKKAKAEIAEEDFRAAVNLEKARLRRPWWIRLFPWKIRLSLIIERR